MNRIDSLNGPDQLIEFGKNQLVGVIRKVRSASSRKDFDPRFRVTIEKYADLASVVSPQELTDQVTDLYLRSLGLDSGSPKSFQIKKSAREFVSRKNAVVLEDPSSFEPKSILFKSTYFKGQTVDFDTLLLFGEEIGHIAHPQIRRTPYNPNASSGSMALEETYAAAAQWSTKPDTIVQRGFITHGQKDGKTIFQIPFHSLMEELRAQLLSMYLAGHVQAQSKGQNFHRAIKETAEFFAKASAATGEDAKLTHVFEIGNLLGWDKVVPVCTGGYLDDFYALCDKKPVVQRFVDEFLAQESKDTLGE